MQIQTGAEDTWFVASATGRVVCTFESEELAREWLDPRKDNGVNYRLLVRRSDTTELVV